MWSFNACVLLVQAWALPIAVATSTLITFILVTLPTRYNGRDDTVAKSDRANVASGTRDQHSKTVENLTKDLSTSVAIFVLGDIGRSPRMQYHALSLADHGARVDLIGYSESDVLPEILCHDMINVVPLHGVPFLLQGGGRALFPIVAPLKVLYQVWSVYYALGYRTRPSRFILVQNPPSIPTLLVAQLVCILRNTRLVIDWHNLGHTILALKLGKNHILVRLSEAYERAIARYAYGHLAVSDAMARWLGREYGIQAKVLHDRPATRFRPITPLERSKLLNKLSETSEDTQAILVGERRLLVSSTSWTPDEDFSILLDALVRYSTSASREANLPSLNVVITGKGPLKDHYLGKVTVLEREHKLDRVNLKTAWLSMEDYALLLGSADVGVSLHNSSSGIDLPMKVVDMFGAGLPVLGYDDFEAWSELVQEGVNGMGFKDASRLAELLCSLLRPKSSQLNILKEGALAESERRWRDEWPKIAGIFDIKT